MEPDTGYSSDKAESFKSSSRRSTTSGSDQNPAITTSASTVNGSAAAGFGPRETTVGGSNERRAISDGSSLLHEIEARSSRKRPAYVGSGRSKTEEVTSRPSFGIDSKSIPKTSTTTGSDQSSVIFIAHPRMSTNTESGQSSIIGAESSARTTTIGSDQSSSTTRGSTTTGPGQSLAIRAESIPRREKIPEPDARWSTVARPITRRSRFSRYTKKESVAVGTDLGWVPAGESTPRRFTRPASSSEPNTETGGRRSILTGTSNESPPRRSTDMWSDPNWQTINQYLDTSSMADWGLADGSVATGPRPRGSTEDESSPWRPTYAQPSQSWKTEEIFPPHLTIDTGSSSGRATYAGYSSSRESNVMSSPRRATYARSSLNRTTEATFRSNLATDVRSTPSRSPDATSGTRMAVDSKASQTGAPGLRSSASGPSVTGFSPSKTPEIVTESTPRRSSATRSIARKKIANRTRTRRLTGDGPRTRIPTAEIGSPVQSDVPEEESAEQKNEWALHDLSVYQLTVKSLVVAVVAGVQFSSGSNGEGGIYCSHRESCIWNNKPEGTIGVDFQLDLIYIMVAVLFSGGIFIGLSRMPGERSWWFLMPWLFMVMFSLQTYHIAAVLNLLAFLTTCSHVSAIFLMFLCLVLFYLEINVFYEVFLCTWHLHEDPSLK